MKPHIACSSDGTGVFKQCAVAAGPLLGWACYWGIGAIASASEQAQLTAGVVAWMAFWWVSEAVPMPVTALLPLILFPLCGVLSFTQAASPYASKIVFLFMGGFMVARAFEAWNLHRRTALHIVLAVGTAPKRLVAGFMLATALLSMWISNTATTMMMTPIALSALSLKDATADAAENTQGEDDPLAIAILLGVAYAANLGGTSTLIGTPPNLILAGFLENYAMKIDFGQWMLLAMPMAFGLIACAWLLLTSVLFRTERSRLHISRAALTKALQDLGPLRRGEITVAIVLALTAVCWIGRGPLARIDAIAHALPPITRLNDAIIALAAVIVLFVIPVDRDGRRALDWETATSIPWGILVLYGGGFSMAAAMTQSGLTDVLAQLVHTFSDLPTLWVVALAVALVTFVTEFTSNVATITAFAPLLYGAAVGLEIAPTALLVPATLAASCAFMLPVATAPNAVVFGSGRIRVGHMVKAGIWMNIVSIATISTVAGRFSASVLVN